MSETVHQAKARLTAAQHAMQSGVAATIQIHPEEVDAKHLRVGVNSALVGQGGLVQLLIDKGLITEEEYFTAAADAMEREKRVYEQRLTQYIEKPVTLQ